MTEKDRKNLYAAAKKTYGEHSQVAIAIEEMGELIAALSQHHFRGRGNKKAVVEEIADVMIVCEQLAHIYGRQDVDKMMDFKLNRLAGRIEKANEEKNSRPGLAIER